MTHSETNEMQRVDTVLSGIEHHTRDRGMPLREEGGRFYAMSSMIGYKPKASFMVIQLLCQAVRLLRMMVWKLDKLESIALYGAGPTRPQETKFEQHKNQGTDPSPDGDQHDR